MTILFFGVSKSSARAVKCFLVEGSDYDSVNEYKPEEEVVALNITDWQCKDARISMENFNVPSGSSQRRANFSTHIILVLRLN